jgi:hypothetical protein
MTVYKLTDEYGQTYNNTHWGPGTVHETDGTGELCGPGWIHSYDSPELAVLLNPIHAAFQKPKLWQASATGKHLLEGGLKRGSTHLKTLKEIPLPECTTEIRIRFAILCALTAYREAAFCAWAVSWLENKDRTSDSARAATEAAARAAWAAETVEWAAAEAAAEAETAARAAADKPINLKEIALQAFDLTYIPTL